MASKNLSETRMKQRRVQINESHQNCFTKETNRLPAPMTTCKEFRSQHSYPQNKSKNTKQTENKQLFLDAS